MADFYEMMADYFSQLPNLQYFQGLKDRPQGSGADVKPGESLYDTLKPAKDSITDWWQKVGEASKRSTAQAHEGLKGVTDFVSKGTAPIFPNRGAELPTDWSAQGPGEGWDITTPKNPTQELLPMLAAGRDKVLDWFGNSKPETDPNLNPWAVPDGTGEARVPSTTAAQADPTMAPIALGSVDLPNVEEYIAGRQSLADSYPSAPDYAGARKYLDAATPSEENYLPSKEDMIGNVLMGLAARGVDPNQGIGPNLLQLGLGGLGGLGAGMREKTQGKKEFARANQQYNLGRAGTESSMAGQQYQGDVAKQQMRGNAMDSAFQVRQQRAGMGMPKVTEKGILQPTVSGNKLDFKYSPLRDPKTTMAMALLGLSGSGGSGGGVSPVTDDYTLAAVTSAAAGNPTLQKFIQGQYGKLLTDSNYAMLGGSNTGAKDASVAAFNTMLSGLTDIANDPTQPVDVRKQAVAQYKQLSMLPLMAAQARMRDDMNKKAVSGLLN